ncbi:hypothetical protein C8Q80DRAFT_1178265 [Daedaleopsis nitida]|nr:hypothetical protein C8Q80DRAFT_1178265 [Daedaleopsis nitida]
MKSKMPHEPLSSPQKLREILSLQDDELDEDLDVVLTSLITSAVHDKDPRIHLDVVTDAVRQSGCTSSLEPLTIIPIVVKCPKESADALIDLMAAECSAKEVVMAIEEIIETLDRHLQEDEGEEGTGDDETSHLSSAKQLVRLIRAYTITIPRLPKWKQSPADLIESRLAELQSVISLLARDTTSEEGRNVVSIVSRLGLGLSDGADATSKDLLRKFIDATIGVFVNALSGGMAKKAFAMQFSRLVVPHPESSTGAAAHSGDALRDTWAALQSLGYTVESYEKLPALPGLILLAHHPTYTFSVDSLTSFYPTVLSSIQSNLALDEVLSILLSSLAPLRKANPIPELSTDLVAPLISLLPHLAANHPDPDIRHYTFRVVSLVLGLSPAPLRFRLLQELLSDEDVPGHMRVAAVGLLKEAVLEGLVAKGKNLFASRLLLSTFGPIVLRPQPPDLSVSLDDFLDSPEPLRLIECLGLYYVLLMRDTEDRTGVRDSAVSVQSSLLRPLRTRMKAWNAELAAQEDRSDVDHDIAMQLGILNMWLDRVQEAIDSISA